jgi:hypothetical protein
LYRLQTRSVYQPPLSLSLSKATRRQLIQGLLGCPQRVAFDKLRLSGDGVFGLK